MSVPPLAVLVIPCLNESTRIGRFLADIAASGNAEEHVLLQVGEDGSSPAEKGRRAAILRTHSESNSSILPPLMLPHNLGKGGAVYAGWDAHPEAEWLGFADADGSCSAKECLRLIAMPRTRHPHSEAYIGSRVKMLGRAVDRRFDRHIVGRVFATLVSNLLHIEAYDTQCGLKLVTSRAWRSIRPLLSIQRFAFDVQLILALLDAGYKVEEVPVDWQEIPGGKVQIARDSFRMFRELLTIRALRQQPDWRKLTHTIKESGFPS